MAPRREFVRMTAMRGDHTAQVSRRRRIGLSLRLAMVAIAVIACAVGWITHQARRQRMAVATIRAAGGDVIYADQIRERLARPPKPRGLPRWKLWIANHLGEEYVRTPVRVSFRSGERKTLYAEVWQAIGNLHSLREIDLAFTHVVASELEKLQGLTELEDLDLSYSGLRDGALKPLAAMPGLKSLDLTQNPTITDEGLAHLRGLTQLTGLGLTRTRVTDAGMRHLKSLKELRVLQIEYTNIGDAGVAELDGLGNLWQLWMDRTRITDAGLAHVAKHPELQHLHLEGTQVTDSGLTHLKALKKLRFLYLNNSRAHYGAVAMLRQSVPRLDLESSGLAPGR